MAQIASVSARSGGSVGRVPMGCVHKTLASIPDGEADPCATTFIRKREPPTADAIFLAIEAGPADAARSGDDNSAISTLMGTNASRSRVRCNDGAAKRVAGLFGRCQSFWFTGARQG